VHGASWSTWSDCNDVVPELERHFYSALSLSGITLKDWFIKAAAEYCEKKKQPFLS